MRLLSESPYLVRTLGLVWRASGRLAPLWLALLLVQGLLPAGAVYLTQPLVDSLTVLIGAGTDSANLRPFLVLAALMGLLLLAIQALDAVSAWVRTAQSDRVRDYVNDLVHRQSTALELAFYDSADFYDHLHRARDESFYRPASLLENLGDLLRNGITLAGLAAVLLPYGAWLPAALVVSTLPALHVLLVHSRRRHHWWVERTPDERRGWYYSWLLTARETAAEMRVFGLGETYRRAYRDLRRRLRRERLRLARDQGLAEMGAGLTSVMVSALVIGWMIWRALHGMATLGDLALFQQAFQRGQRIMGSLLANAGQVYANSLFLRNLFEFLELRPGLDDPPQPRRCPDALERGIRFEGVSFRYPGAAQPTLAGLDLTLPAGQITAVLGTNGAGKSTLAKLICRLYDPQEGRVTMDDVDLRDVSRDELRRRLGVLFQEPVRYNATVAESIRPGDPGLADPGLVRRAARNAGADAFIEGLPAGYDTLLGKWFEGGLELSGGQWQRLALARALYRQAPVLVLDEPTSAMDPWAESAWIRGFRDLARGRTALVITHRFTTAMGADVIHVMEGGRIVESGSHARLLALGGRYADSWRAHQGAGR